MLLDELAKLSSTVFNSYILAARLEAIAAVSHIFCSDIYFADPAVSAPIKIS